MEKSPVLWPGTANREGCAFLAIFFFLIVEINLGGKFGGHAFSKERLANTSEALLAQNLTIPILSPQTTQDTFVLFQVTLDSAAL